MIKWPKIKRIQTAPAAKHYVAVDGSDIQVNQDGQILARFRAGKVVTAERQRDRDKAPKIEKQRHSSRCSSRQAATEE